MDTDASVNCGLTSRDRSEHFSRLKREYIHRFQRGRGLCATYKHTGRYIGLPPTTNIRLKTSLFAVQQQLATVTSSTQRPTWQSDACFAKTSSFMDVFFSHAAAHEFGDEYLHKLYNPLAKQWLFKLTFSTQGKC